MRQTGRLHKGPGAALENGGQGSTLEGGDAYTGKDEKEAAGEGLEEGRSRQRTEGLDGERAWLP